MPQSFAEMSFDQEILIANRLPPIPYPMPIAAFQEVVQSGGKFDIGDLLYWLMNYLDLPDIDDRFEYERALLQIAENHIPTTDEKAIRVQIDGMAPVSFWCAPVDIAKPLVSFERQNQLVAIAQASDEPTRMKISAYAPVGGSLALAVLGYSVETFMHEEYDSFPALLHKALYGWSNFYAVKAGKLHRCPSLTA